MSYYRQDSVFWIEVDKISANPYQPRREFNQEELQSLANSIRQYGVLQALVVTRKEVPKKDGGLAVEYELISGERRLRASKLAGIKEVPVLIREGGETDLMKLELAIIENLQREDLNVVERARAFEKLAKEFSFNKTQIAKKVGKSREYVSNSMRVLSLPEEILGALSAGKMSEGHARPLLMLVDKPQEQQTLFKEILYKKISVREAERIAKKIAKDRVRKPGKINPEIEALEKEFTDSLGTRVNIESKEVGGKISIDYFSNEDLISLLEVLKMYKKKGNAPMLESFIADAEKKELSEIELKNATEKEEVLDESEEPVNDESKKMEIEYILSQKERGIDDEKIKEALLEAGWDEESISFGFAEAKKLFQKDGSDNEQTDVSGLSLTMEREDDPLGFLLEDDEEEPVKEEEKSETIKEQKPEENVKETSEKEVETEKKLEEKSIVTEEQVQEDTASETSKTEQDTHETETDEEDQEKEALEASNQKSDSSDTEEKVTKEEDEEDESISVKKEEDVQEEPVDDEPKSIQEAIEKREEQEHEIRDNPKTLEEVVAKKFATSDSYDQKNVEDNIESKTEKEKLEEILKQKETNKDKGDDDIYSVRNFSL